MNYHGMPVKEFTSDKPVQFAEHTDMLVWNDNSSTEFPTIVYAHEVIYYDPRVPKNRVLTRYGEHYDHCAVVPNETDNSRYATCGELKAWLNHHPNTFVIGKAYKDGFQETRSTKAVDYCPPPLVVNRPCNDNGLFNVSAILFIANLTKPMKPTTSNLIYGVEGLYEPTAEQIQENETAFVGYYSIIAVEHKAVKGVNRYAFGKFEDKSKATDVAKGIIEYLGGNAFEGSKDVYVIPTASVIDMPKCNCDTNEDAELIPVYLKYAYYCSLDKVFPKKCDPITGISMTERATMVNRLRQQTERGLMPCKRALEECGWDYDKAYALVKGLPSVQASEEIARENSNKDANSRQATAFDLVRSEIAKRCEDDNPFMPKVWM